MIGIKGQYVMSTKVGDIQDPIKSESLIRLMITMQAGGSLPTFDVVFKTKDRKVIDHINEGNIFTFAIGRTESDAIEYKIQIIDPYIQPKSNAETIVMFKGFTDSFKYLNEPKAIIHKQMSAMDAVKAAASNHFDVEADYASDASVQNWIQPLTTDMSFVTSTLLRADLGSSFPLCAVTPENKFRLFDIDTILGNDPAFLFSSVAEQGRNVTIIEPDYNVRLGSTIQNFFGGYGVSLSERDLTQGTNTDINSSAQLKISTSAAFSRMTTAKPKPKGIRYKNDYVNASYNSAQLNNVERLSLFGSAEIDFNFSNQFVPIVPLDVIQFTDPQITDDKRVTNPTYAGTYLTSYVCLLIQDNKINIRVNGVRDSLDRQQGNLR